MKILMLSDLHLVNENPIARLDDLTETQWDKLDYIFSYAKNRKIDLILQAGDLTHTKRSWSLLQRLTEFLQRYKIPFYFVKGQHDSYFRDMENNKTTTGILMEAGLIQKLDSRGTVINDEVGLFGASYGEEVRDDYLGDTVFNILVIHAPIAETKIPHVEFTDAKRFLKKYVEYDLILCGDIHQKFLIKHQDRWICNTGSLLRTEATKEMFDHKPCFYVYDTLKNTVETVSIPVSPAKKVLSRNHLDKQKQTQERFEDFINRVQSASGVNSADFTSNLNLIIEENKTSPEVVRLIHHYMTQERSDI